MNIDKKTYKKYATAHAPKSPVVPDCIKAFCVGGAICAFAELLTNLYMMRGYTDIGNTHFSRGSVYGNRCF